MNREWLQSVGKQISDARKNARITQQELAAYIGITRVQLSKYERGRVKAPSAAVLSMAVEKLNFPLILNGMSLGPSDLAPPRKSKSQKPPLQLKLPFKTVRDAMRILRAVNRGARVTVEKQRGQIILQAIFQRRRSA